MSFANVYIGATAGDQTGDQLRNAFLKINRNFANIDAGTAGISVSSPVNTVAGRTGNIILAVNDVVGAASIGYVNTITSAANTFVTTTYAQFSGNVFDWISANLAGNITNAAAISITTSNVLAPLTGFQAHLTAANLRITAHDANLGTATTNITALQSTQDTQSANLGTATTNITTLFANAGTQASSISTINANIIAANLRIAAHDANLGTATTNITTLTANAGIQSAAIQSTDNLVSFTTGTVIELRANITAANLVIATHTTNISSINANVLAANLRITAHDANLGTATTNISSINANVLAANIAIAAVTSAWTANAATQGSALTTLTANAATQDSALTTLTANAATQSTAIVSLNTTVGQHTANISSLFSITATHDANLGSKTTLINNLSSDSSDQQAEIDLLNANVAAITTGSGLATLPQLTANILAVNASVIAANTVASNATIAANTAMKSYVDSQIISVSGYGNTQVAQYLVVNPQPGTYSNSNVGAYLPTSTVTTGLVANVTAANVEIGKLRANITAANVAVGIFETDFSLLLGNTISNVTALTATVNGIDVSLFANAASQQTAIIGLRANITAANAAISTLQTQVYANANVATYLPTHSGNVSAGNVISNHFRYSANGVSILTGVPGTYSNANVVANLQNLTSNISTTANVNTGRVYANGFFFANGIPYAPATTIIPGPFYQDIILANTSTSTVTLDTAVAAAFYLANLSANITVDLINFVDTGNIVTTVTTIISQGATPYSITAVKVNGNAIISHWSNSTTAFEGTPNGIDYDGLGMVRVGNVWTVLHDVTSYL